MATARLFTFRGYQSRASDSMRTPLALALNQYMLTVSASHPQKLALWSSAFLIASWVLALGFVQRPLVLADKIFLYGVLPVLSFSIPPMIILNWPRDHCVIYQTVLVFAIWSRSVYIIIFL